MYVFEVAGVEVASDRVVVERSLMSQEVETGWEDMAFSLGRCVYLNGCCGVTK